MTKKITIKINGKAVSCQEGETVFEVARKNKIFIPGLCQHNDFPAKANCRLCAVEIKGVKNLATSCTALVQKGMEIKTETARVKKARNMNIELLFAAHIEKCPTCIWRYQCQLLSFAEKYKILITRFRDRKGIRKTYKFANAVEIDGSQCIDCRNCLEACAAQKINYLELTGKGTAQEIEPTQKDGVYCILCGQCAVHCPVSAAQEQSDWEKVERVLKRKNKVMVAQFAPSIRVSIGEDFGIPYAKIGAENVVAGLRSLGFQYVFDVNFGADITTMVEAEELLDRVKKKGKMPMFTSCCPAWVNYVEFYHPELIPNLTTSRSPHIHNGGAIKTYWANLLGLRPENIIVVSIMPCTAKKYEASRKEMKINGLRPVDYVLTTREFSFLLKKNKLDLAKLKKSQADSPLGIYSGASAIYGASGGVMESALRTAHATVCGSGKNKICRSKIDFKEARGLNGIKEAIVDLAGKKLRIAVVNGIGNIGPVIGNLKKYDYVEVMACPGGCIGGGGQPLPTDDETRKKRMEALYRLDKSKKIRKAHENKEATEVLKWLKKKGHIAEHSVLHTSYKKKTKY